MVKEFFSSVEEFYGTRYQSGSFSFQSMWGVIFSSFHCLCKFFFFYSKDIRCFILHPANPIIGSANNIENFISQNQSHPNLCKMATCYFPSKHRDVHRTTSHSCNKLD
jgi:hypothetical protein